MSIRAQPTAHVTWKPFINGCAAFNRYIALPDTTASIKPNSTLFEMAKRGASMESDEVHDEVSQEQHVVG